MKKTFVKADILDEQGNLVKDQFIEQEKLVSSLETHKTPFTPEQRKEYEAKIQRLHQLIMRYTFMAETGLNPETKQDIGEYAKLMVELYRDELQMDLAEDMDLVKYNGQIPKHINVRKSKKCGKVYDRWIERMGRDAFFELKENVDETFRGKVSVEIDPTTGGGKL